MRRAKRVMLIVATALAAMAGSFLIERLAKSQALHSSRRALLLTVWKETLRARVTRGQ